MVIGTTFLAPVLLRLVLKGKPLKMGMKFLRSSRLIRLAGAS